MANELPLIEQWLYQTLSGDATIVGLIGNRVFAYLIPQDATLPALVYTFQNAQDVEGCTGCRLIVKATYQVKAVDKSESVAGVKALNDRVDALLQRKTGAVTGLDVLTCLRQYPFEYVELQDGAQFRHAGGVYEIVAQGA